MKNILIQTIFFIALAISANAQLQVGQPQNDCTDLFITELTFGKNPRANNNFDLNYAIEIFNSSNASINLANYSLDLATSAGVVSSIPLSGSLASHAVYVIGNANADLNMQGLCDQLSGDLDFEQNVSLELKRGTNIIDKLGLGGSSIPQSFDASQFASDPIGYLQNFHLDLNDYKNIDIRRSMLAQHGNPNFNASTDVLGEWWYTPNVDRSDIGNYTGVCNKPLGIDLVGYLTSSSYIDYPNFNMDNLDINVNNSVNGTVACTPNVELTHTETSITSTSAVVCNDGSVLAPDLMFNATNTFSTTALNLSCHGVTIGYPNNGIKSGCQVEATGWNSVGKACTFILTSTTNCVTIDPAKNFHITKIDHSVGANSIKENKLLQAAIYPTFISQSFTIDCKEKYKYVVYDMLGVIAMIGNSNGTHQIDASSLANGVYTVSISNLGGSITNIKFIKL